MLVWTDPSAKALVKLSAVISVRVMQALQLGIVLLTGGNSTKAVFCVGGHETLTLFCLYLITEQVRVPGYLYLYDVITINLVVQVLNCVFPYTTLMVIAAVAVLLYYSLALQHTQVPHPPRPPAVRRKYTKKH